MEKSKVLNRFNIMVHRLRHRKGYAPAKNPDEPYGTFKKRRLIGEHTHINGGVYLGASPQEAVVIDDHAKDSILNNIFSEWVLSYVRYIHNPEQEPDECKIISSVITHVQNNLHLVRDEDDHELAGLTNCKDKKIALDVFIEKKIGFHRHQILLAAYLLEKITEAGHLKGKIYIDGITNEKLERKERLIYSSASGNLFIFNPSSGN